MAAFTRKRSAFSVFKSSITTEKERKLQSLEIESTPNLVELGLTAEYEEQKPEIKTRAGRARRGSLSDLDKKRQEDSVRTPKTVRPKAQKAQECKSEPRLKSLRKSFKRKKKDQTKQATSSTSSIVNGESGRESKVPRLEMSNSEENISLNKAPICHIQMSSLENLKADENSKLSLSCDEVLHWLIKPVNPKKFFRDVWEKKPLFIKRRQPAYNDGWFSTKELDSILRENIVKFGENLDVTTYKDGQRETPNPPGRAYSSVVWDFYKSFSESMWKLTSILQEYFGVFVGANIYLTPPGSQGFSPHYDDIEAFILQLEGRKHWKLYSPRNITESLPRYSSENFTQDEVGEPILDKILEPGDCLYFPRGFIHQAKTTDDAHSLHITLSVYQKNTWGDFLERLIPVALQTAIDEDVEFRKGLPIGYMNHVGVSNSDKATSERSDFLKRIQQLIMKLATYAPIDAAADQMAAGYIHCTSPPLLTEEELRCSVQGNGAFWDNERVHGEAKLTSASEVRLIRPGIARLVIEDGCAIIYHTMGNAKVAGPSSAALSITLPLEEADAAEHLLNSYPDYVSVDSVPLASYEDKIRIVKCLYSHGILRTRHPLIQDSAV
eukprot:gene20471-22487_t